MARAVDARQSLKRVIGDIPAQVLVMLLSSLGPDETFIGDVFHSGQHANKMTAVLVNGQSAEALELVTLQPRRGRRES